MKNSPTLLSWQFSSVTAVKAIMKNITPGQSYKRFFKQAISKNRELRKLKFLGFLKIY